MATQTLPEWLNGNLTRMYPLSDTATGQTVDARSLPTSFLADLRLDVPPSSDGDYTTNFYLKQVDVYTSYINMEIWYDDGVNDIRAAIVQNIPTSVDVGSELIDRTFTVTGVETSTVGFETFANITGSVIIGTAADISTIPTVYTFEKTGGNLIPCIISMGTLAVNSILAQSRILTGNVYLKEGANVQITPAYDETNDVTTITISATAVESIGTEIVDSATLLAAIVERYGVPIRTVNGIAPDSNGNFTLTGADCTSVATAEASNALAIHNTCAKPCCDKSTLTPVYQTLADQNLAFATLDKYYESLTVAINTLQSKLSALGTAS